MLRANRRQAQRLYQTLREHLGQSPEGQELLAAFELNPDSGGQDLAAYLREQLPEDEALARKLASALDSEAGAQQITVVAGGQVDQIVNIARLGVLNLTVKRHLSIFRDVRQLVVFLAVVLIVGGALSFVAWKSRQPKTMTGDFNIAVAQFGESDDNGQIKASKQAAGISNSLSNFLDSEYSTAKFGPAVMVMHTNMPLIREDRDAGQLAKKIRADVVIYGTILSNGSPAEVHPRFWVADNAFTWELTGQNALARPIPIDTDEPALSGAPASLVLKQRAQLLVQFTQALVYLKAKRLDEAGTLLNGAIAQLEGEPYFQGKEVLYLMRSAVMRRLLKFDEALQDARTSRELNPTYTRGWLAEGNVYFDQYLATSDQDRYDLLDLALQSYHGAILQADNAPIGAYVREKAFVALGNTYLELTRNESSSCDLSQPAQSAYACELFQQAMDYFGKVIFSYENSGDASFRKDIQELAAIAYFGMGVAYERQNRRDAAIESYRAAAEATYNDELRTRAEYYTKALLVPAG